MNGLRDEQRGGIKFMNSSAIVSAFGILYVALSGYILDFMKILFISAIKMIKKAIRNRR